MITRRAPLRGDTAARRRERLIGELETSVQGFAEAERPMAADGQPIVMRVPAWNRNAVKEVPH